jgi:murein DD-endopeptidase MepM/ murein hydrolase activator NlpD
MKKASIYILVCILIITLFISLIFIGCKKTTVNIAQETTAVAEGSIIEEKTEDSTSTETLSQESPEKFSAVFEPFILPVDIKYIGTAFIDKRPAEGDTYETTFLLDKGAEISAIFSGKIIIIQELEQFGGEKVSPYYWVEIETEDHLYLTYLFLGEALVKKEDIVNQGQKVAISNGGDFAPSVKGNFKIRIAEETQEEWKYFDLLK